MRACASALRQKRPPRAHALAAPSGTLILERSPGAWAPAAGKAGVASLTSRLCEEGTSSSILRCVKMSSATKWHFAWPCLPVLDVETSTTCAHRRQPP